MTTIQFVLFVASMFLPTLYFRIKFEEDRRSFEELNAFRQGGLQVHHGHYGYVLLVAAAFLLAFGWHNAFVTTPLGFGIGLTLDEIIPMLKMPSVGREVELNVYESTATGTLLLVFGICFLLEAGYFCLTYLF